MDKDQRDKEARQTPIVDGDARPDMPVDIENEAKKDKRDKPDKEGKEEKFESERMSDINSLEDFKDAKKP